VNQDWWNVHDPWTLAAFVAFCILQAWQIYNQRGLHHQLNSLTDARVLQAGELGRSEGRAQGAATEQARAASQLKVATDATQRLEEIRGDQPK
jgi:hypothetical protein